MKLVVFCTTSAALLLLAIAACGGESQNPDGALGSPEPAVPTVEAENPPSPAAATTDVGRALAAIFVPEPRDATLVDIPDSVVPVVSRAIASVATVDKTTATLRGAIPFETQEGFLSDGDDVLIVTGSDEIADEGAEASLKLWRAMQIAKEVAVVAEQDGLAPITAVTGEIKRPDGRVYIEMTLLVDKGAVRVPASEISEESANAALAILGANVSEAEAEVVDSVAYRLESGLAIELKIRVADPAAFVPDYPQHSFDLMGGEDTPWKADALTVVGPNDEPVLVVTTDRVFPTGGLWVAPKYHQLINRLPFSAGVVGRDDR